ncbi:MAG: precorrin-4 C(11)-methyltransferase [Candidatus Methanomethylophilus sp.]|nr:precorrin-4 C(11)-methyltransferase [Methanomethylophilus sp.]
MAAMVHFIGAGPGDPELITIKGQRLIEEADVIIFAGSLVNPAVLDKRKKDSVVYDSAYMSLDEVMDVTIPAVKEGKTVARVHTGDPSIYGAIREQMVRLDAEKIEYDVIPGVSSFCASAAAVKKEFTLPSVSQTVIITRMEGRTPVPPREKLVDLAKHHASMCIFLSVNFMDELTKTLMEAGYEPDTPMAVVYRASWPDQKIVYGTCATMAKIVKENNISRQAMTMVGGFLGDEFELSKLYDSHFTTGYRQGKD